MNDMRVREAKTRATSRGKSVSQMFGEFVTVKRSQGLPPVTNSLLGVMKGRLVSEQDYKRHLREN